VVLESLNPDYAFSLAADALQDYVGDADRRIADGEAARARASAYTWDASAASVVAVYRELLGIDACA